MAIRTNPAESQPSVRSAVVTVRVLGISLGLSSVAVGVGAWSHGTVGWLVAYLGMSAVLFVSIIFLSAIPRRRQRRLDHEWARRFHELAIRDELTGLFNRRYFNEQLAALIRECRASHKPLTIALLDLNDFKTINDTFGHHAGDIALQTVAASLTRAVGDAGIISRTGGDEFAVILPGLPPHEVQRLVKTIRAAFEDAQVPLPDVTDGLPRLNAAVGLAALDDFTEADRLLRDADNALYANKAELGRMYDRRRAS